MTIELLTLALLSGYIYQKFVSKPYSCWGEESHINPVAMAIDFAGTFCKTYQSRSVSTAGSQHG